MDPTADAPTALLDFADELALFSTEVLRFRIRNKATLGDAERQSLEDLEIRIDGATAKVRADGITALGFLLQNQITEVAGAAASAQSFLRRIKRVDKALAAVTAVLGLGLAVLDRSPKAIAEAARSLKSSLT
jgi:hypothetical protein